MPVVHFHIAKAHEPAKVQRLLTRASHEYARILSSPIERVRAFAVRYAAADLAVAGVVGGVDAPYFSAFVLSGRPREQSRELLARFTDLIVEELGVPRERVRGRVEELDPELWGIGGVPASAMRRDEIAARAAEGE